MEQSFWHERWTEGRLGFHMGHPHPALDRHWSAFQSSADSRRVLVPLCGKSHDLLWLRERGHEVAGVEFIQKAIDDFVNENHLEATTQPTSFGSVTTAGTLRLVCADFYRLTPAEIGLADAVYDRAAFVAISPERRSEYAARLHALTRPGARLFLLSFVLDAPGGPPFSIPEPELLDAFAPFFELKLRDEADILEEEPRFRERGATFFREQVWFGSRIGPAGL